MSVNFFQKALTTLHYLTVCGLKITGIPGVRDLARMVCEIKEHVHLVFGIVGNDAFQVSQVHTIHDDQIIKPLIICPGDLAGMVAVAGNAVLGKLSPGGRVDRVANLFRAGGCGGDVEIGGTAGFSDYVF